MNSMRGVHVLVVGDVMIDRYWQGPAERVSPEAPVPVVAVEQRTAYPGGAANVALNIVSLGAQCTLVGCVGDDEAGTELSNTLTAAGVNCDLIALPDWNTVVKLRIVAQGQQLLRADFETPLPMSGESERLAMLQNKVEKHLQSVQVLVLEDYDKGVLDDPQPLIHAARQRNVPVLVDPKLKPVAAYRGATVLKPNAKEFAHATRDAASRSDAARQLIEDLQLSGLVVTRGAEGMECYSPTEVRHIAARPVEVFDVTGAGDTTAAALAVGMAMELPLFEVAQLANVAASIAVTKFGTATVTGPELSRAMTTKGGLIAAGDLEQEVVAAKAQGERIVFTNGCFDILHAGHVAYLEEAAGLGDRLIVAINDDASVTRLKGAGRPVVSVQGRSRVLAGLGCVDWVVQFSEDTPLDLLARLQPDVLVKGGDYDVSKVVGGDYVTSYGGEVRVLSHIADVSTTAIVERMRSLDE